MTDIEAKQERILKIKIFSLFVFISLTIVLFLNYIVIPGISPICELKEKDYKGSMLEKDGVPIEKARIMCKSNLIELRLFTLIFFSVPAITIWLLYSGKNKPYNQSK